MAQEDDPKNLPRDGSQISTELDNKAAYFKKESYLAVKGQYDLMDDIRATLWANLENKQAILTGCLWRSVWTRTSGGIIPKFNLDKEGFGHAFAIVGWKEIAGEIYLIAQLSNGTDIGDKGYFYFPRSIVNKEFSYGCYVFNDMPAFEVKNRGWSWGRRAFEIVKNYLAEILM